MESDGRAYDIDGNREGWKRLGLRSEVNGIIQLSSETLYFWGFFYHYI
jgi:hypothetical protein